jgi:hypothetical protein
MESSILVYSYGVQICTCLITYVPPGLQARLGTSLTVCSAICLNQGNNTTICIAELVRRRAPGHSLKIGAED